MFVKVLIPFHRSETDKDVNIGDVIEVSEEEFARIRKVGVNMVIEVEKPKKKRAKKQ
jgi:hypothetical protein